MGMIYAPPSIIPNGALINDVCHIYQSTKPTTRPDGSVLVVGDIWYNISTGVTGFWNGTYWLSQEREAIFCANGSFLSDLFFRFNVDKNIFVHRTIDMARPLLPHDGNNYWRILIQKVEDDNASAGVELGGNILSTQNAGTTTINSIRSISEPLFNSKMVIVRFAKIGSPSGNFVASSTMIYSQIL